MNRLRTAAMVAAAIVAPVSLGLMLRVGRNAPVFLIAIFVCWVLAPFVLLIGADVMGKRWSSTTRTALYVVTLVVAAGSLAIYINDALRPRTSQPAFVYTIVPPVACVLMAAAVGVAAVVGRRSPRG